MSAPKSFSDFQDLHGPFLLIFNCLTYANEQFNYFFLTDEKLQLILSYGTESKHPVNMTDFDSRFHPLHQAMKLLGNDFTNLKKKKKVITFFF